MRIEENNNGLPFFIAKLNQCNASLHRHKFVQIIYVIKGKLKHMLNNTIFDIHKGDIFIIPPYVPHKFINNENESYEIIEFEFIPEFLNERFSIDYSESSSMDFAYLEPFLVTENEITPRLNLCGNIQLAVEELFAEILLEYETRNSDYPLIIRALLEKMLVLIGREYKRAISGTDSQQLFDRHRDALAKAIKFINENLTESISVKQSAKVAMLSESYFRYLFRQMFKKSFVEYVNERRIILAAELLKSKPNMRVIDICFSAGFNNINHFNRVFRQITGLTPTAFRKSRKL